MHGSLRSALANVFQIPIRPALRRAVPASTSTLCINRPANSSTPKSESSFSTSAAQYARKRGGARPDRRITLIRFHLYHPTTLTPRPLRFSRNRHLRHWTITRAWNLFRHARLRSREMELERQYNAMRDANEELRIAAGDGGRLFRKAQMKQGVWGIGRQGVPIEYARGLVEWVGSTGGMGGGTTQEGSEGGGKGAKIWDYSWKRY